ncbi:RNA polymerase subunit sigma-70 [Sinorhizobium glycinis]|uniref:RNA polymerase subunit sigma-70 n=1 Tax=Sinorhizobium glycinis TaxID=1472378 RepID=A0A178XNU8_9HYPH|nr:sigma-70 family RNA polymerase sigma factor [Sinorhizobium glycinis]OAP36422.1 RNA polymerase subunit sigma-70 [Sinorhizobium glycinis]
MFNVSEPPANETLRTALALRPKLLAAARRITRNPTAAEDVVQDVLLQLVSAPLRPDVVAPAHYLMRMVRNQAMDHLRRTKREQGLFIVDKISGCASVYGNPEECVRQCQAYSALQETVGAMPPRTRMFYERHYFDNVPQKVIAEEAGVSPALVCGLLREAHTRCLDAVCAEERKEPSCKTACPRRFASQASYQ